MPDQETVRPTPGADHDADFSKLPKGIGRLLRDLGLTPELRGYIAGREDAINWKQIGFVSLVVGGASVGCTYAFCQWWFFITYILPSLLG